jgi:hypothetical protein
MAACGSDPEPRRPAEVAACLRAGGAVVELNPRVSDEVGPNFAPVLTRDTKVVAGGALTAGANFWLRAFRGAA